MLDVGGQDSTEAFEDVGHSDEAREILDGLLVGNLKRQVRSPAFLYCPWRPLHHLMPSFVLQISPSDSPRAPAPARNRSANIPHSRNAQLGTDKLT